MSTDFAWRPVAASRWKSSIEETYAGLLEGITTHAENNARIVRQVSRMDKIWGPRPAYVVPAISRISPWGSDLRRNVRLPRYCYYIWLTSKEMDERFSGSELVVIWFGQKEKELPLLSMIERACRDVPWEKYARDFDY